MNTCFFLTLLCLKATFICLTLWSRGKEIFATPCLSGPPSATAFPGPKGHPICISVGCPVLGG